MNTLKELGEFVGIPQGAMDLARYNKSLTISLGNVSLLTSRRDRPASLRTIADTLKSLPLITLEASLIGPRVGPEPLNFQVRVNVCEGIVWNTTVYLHPGKSALPYSSREIEQSESEVRLGLGGSGPWQIIVERNGISTTGLVTFKRDLDSVVVQGKPTEPEPIVEPPPPQPPTISVESSGDGSFKVSGSGFIPLNSTVSIVIGILGIVQNPLVLKVTASNGGFQNFPTGNICSNHKGVTLYFWASDGRVYKGQQVKSNQVQLSCPY